MTATPLERLPGRDADVGGATVRRLLPTKGRRTVGAWCFLDQLAAPDDSAGGTGGGMQIGPHPHIGLQTVTWLLGGELLHLDSLGSSQRIRPGQLNLMTAGRGVVHAEERPPDAPDAPAGGAQLWIAQPEATRHGDPAFEHHASLPTVDLGPWHATVLVGAFGGEASSARTDTPLVGVALAAHDTGTHALALRPDFEHAVAVLSGTLTIEDQVIEPGELVWLGAGRDRLAATATGPVDALLLGGEPFETTPRLWWNFVARTEAEIDEAARDWAEGHERFGPVASSLARIDGPTRR